MSDSVSFDRAAAYYDRTRGFSPDGTRRTVELLAGELRGRGPILEIGVGTGQLTLPLRSTGLEVIGLDLSRPMLERLRTKDGPDVPLVEADATRLPFEDHAFGAAYFRWVLHLIPAWETALAELVRAVAAGGVVVADLGSSDSGVRGEIRRRFVEVSGIAAEPPGLDWSDWNSLDGAMARLGAHARPLPAFTEVGRDGPDVLMDSLEQNLHSWTWPMPEELRLRAAAEVRAWAVARFGPLEEAARDEYEIAWRAYDLA